MREAAKWYDLEQVNKVTLQRLATLKIIQKLDALNRENKLEQHAEAEQGIE